MNHLSKNPDNIVIGLYRSPSTASKLLHLVKERPNVHAIQADVGKVTDLQVSLQFYCVTHTNVVGSLCLRQSAAQQASEILNGKLDLLINNAFYAGEPAKFCAPIHQRSVHTT